MSGPVFGKPSRKSQDASLESTAEPDGPANKRAPLRTSSATDAHLRIVSLQIGEREAVNTIKSLCQEFMENYGVSVKIDEIVDQLSGVLIMGNMMKRIGQEKVHFEATLNRRVKEYELLINHKNELMEQMEMMVSQLQAQIAQEKDSSQEEKMRHTHRITIINKEMQNVREENADLKLENERLRKKLESQEKALMNIPRLEEQYMRSARSAVRQSEVANTFNRIEFKKMEEELKNLTFWKNKAKSMEETINKLKIDIEHLDLQNRTNLSRYQNLLRTAKIAQNINSGVGGGGGGGGGDDIHSPVGAGKPGTNGIRLPRPNSANGNVTSKVLSSKRPGSAPSIRRSSSAKATATTTISAEKDTGNSNSDASSAMRNSSDKNNEHAPTQEKTNNKTNSSAADEIIRLRNELRKKDRLIVQLSQTLSFARSRPLLATVEDNLDAKQNRRNLDGSGLEKLFDDDGLSSDQSDDDDLGNGATKSAMKRKEMMRSANPLIGTDMQHLPYMQDEYDDSSLARAEEEALQEERVRRAVELQLQYSAQLQDRRSQGPAHIVAIRQARNFGKAIDDLVAERDRVFLQQKLATSQRDILLAQK